MEDVNFIWKCEHQVGFKFLFMILVLLNIKIYKHIK